MSREVTFPRLAQPIIAIPERTRATWLASPETVDADARLVVSEPGIEGVLEIWLDQPDLWKEDLARGALEALLVSAHQAGHVVRYEGMFAAAPEAIGVSRNGIHIEVNTPYLKLFGYEHRDELLGTATLDLLAPHERERVRGYVLDRRAGLPAPVHYEARGVRKDGTEIDVAARVFADSTGDVTDVIAILEDITEHKRQATALHELQELYRAVFQGNSAMKLCHDPTSGRIVNANEAACRFYGLSYAELAHKNVADISVPEDTPRLLAGPTETPPGPWQSRHRVADAQLRDVEIHPSAIFVDGRALVLSIIFDVTERRRLEERLHEAQKMETIGRLAGGIAHDFNNLLTVILGNCDSLRESTDEATRSAATDAYLAGRRAAELTRQLLAYARRQMLLPKDEDLSSVLHSLTPLLRRALADNVAVTVEAEGVLPVFVDRAQVEYALLYVVSHAADRLSWGGAVVVRAALEGDEAVLTVHDDGPPVTDGELQTLFEPFGPSRVGLGLGTVRGTVAQSGGTVEAVPGVRGLAVRMRFPVRRQPTPPSPQVGPSAAQDNTQRKTILVVEDQDEVRAFLVYRLRHDGHEVLDAPTGERAIHLADGRRIDLLVSDVVMPGMSGFDCYRALAETHPELRVLFVSGHSELIAADQARLPEGASLLQKPFTGPKLSSAVRAVLSGHRAISASPP